MSKPRSRQAARATVGPGKDEPVIWRASPPLFVAGSVLMLAMAQWPWKWLISGAPFITYILLLGAATGNRILPFIPVWTLVTSINLTYAICATSWLLYWFFALSCYPSVFVACVWQFTFFSNIVRRSLRSVVRRLHFVNDKIAFFNIPALEIDTDVEGLLVIRGITFSLSTLTIVAHGVEVGIKLSDDMELALQCEETTISLFRGIKVGDVFGNLKGGQYEMSFGHLAEKTDDSDGESLMDSGTPLLRAATEKANGSASGKIKMRDRMTDGAAPTDLSAKGAYELLKGFSPDDHRASGRYEEALAEIENTSLVTKARQNIDDLLHEDDKGNLALEHDKRTVVCAQLHDKPSIPHPPKHSVKVTTLQTLMPGPMRRFVHRMPLLYRLLLSPLSYFHPVSISSITVTGSGKFIQHTLEDKLFKDYGEQDMEIRHLQRSVCGWLDHANFALQLADISGNAQVPIITAFDISCYLAFEEIIAYRTPTNSIDLKEVIRLGGADAAVNIPSFLLPHHEHILPPKPTQQDKDEQEAAVAFADRNNAKPKMEQAQHTLDQTHKDETNIRISCHARLPAVFDQELLDFAAALVKATKIVELEKMPNPLDEDVHHIRDFGRQIGTAVKGTLKQATVSTVANDRWIAKLVGKITKKLETAQGDVGYSGDIPVALDVYRSHKEAVSKLLL